MKQVISIADFATLLNALNELIRQMEKLTRIEIDPVRYKEAKKEHLEALKNDPYYKSLLHAKQSLENCNVEVEVPDIKVEKE